MDDHLMARIVAYIDHRLGDPDLCPPTIAAAHYLSIRGLYRMFEARGLSAARYIRSRRLEKCRDELGSPGMTGVPVGVIAQRWGFRSCSHFSRVFLEEYGVSPAAYRKRGTEKKAA